MIEKETKKNLKTMSLANLKIYLKSVEFLKLNNYQVIFTGQPSDKDKKIFTIVYFMTI